MGDVTIESTTDNPEDLQRAADMGPEGKRGMDTGMRVEIPDDGTATVVSKQEIITAKDNVQPRTVVDDKVVPTEPVADPGTPPEEPVKEPEPAVEATAPQPKKKQTAQERIDQIQGTIKDLTTQKYETQRDVNTARGELQSLQDELAYVRAQLGNAPPAEQPPEQPPVEAKPDQPDAGPTKPEQKDFESYDEYRDAIEDWKADKRDKALFTKLEKRLSDRDEAIRQASAEDAATAARTTLEGQFQGRMKAAREAHPDFDAIIGKNPTLRTTPAMEISIMKSPVGPELMMHFGNNPAEGERIAAMSPGDQIFEMGMLAATLSVAPAPTTPASTETVIPEPTTKASTPVEPVVSAPTENTVPDDQLSFQDYKIRRRKQEEAAAARR